MRPTFTTLLFLAFSWSLLLGQTPEFLFARTGTDASINQMLVDSVGNVYSIGSYRNSFEYDGSEIDGNTQSEGDLFILKTSPSGEKIYLHSIHGMGNGDTISVSAFSINEKGELAVIINTSATDQIIIASQTINLKPSTGSKVLIKISKNGFLNWVKEVSAIGSDAEIYPKDITLDESGSIFVTGDFNADSIDLDGGYLLGIDTISKIFLCKYSSDGILLWKSTCDHDPAPGAGGIYAEEIVLGSDGNILIGGHHTGTKRFLFNTDELQCKGIRNAYVAAFSPDGNALWALPFEGDNYVIPGKLAVDNMGNIGFTCFYKTSSLIANGVLYTSSNDYDLLLCHIRSDGSFNWIQSLNTNISFVSIDSEKATCGFNSTGSLYLVCEAADSYNYVAFFEFNGENQAIESILYTTGPGSSYMDETIIDRDGNILFSGSTNEIFSLGSYTIGDATGYSTSYFGRIKSNGDIDYIYQMQNNNVPVIFSGLGTDYYGNAFIGGEFNGAGAYLDDIPLTDNYDQGLFIAEYNKPGSITGKVQDFYSSPVKGKLTMYGYTFLQKSPIADSIQIEQDGTFEFNNVPFGKYLLLLSPDNSEGGQYLDTYFPVSGHWENAVQIVIDEAHLNHSNIFIIVPEKATNQGASELSGSISIIEEVDVFKSVKTKPSTKSKAKLAKRNSNSDYLVISETESDEEGYFEFINVADGDYVILIDIPGLPNIDPHNVTVSNGQHLSGFNYHIDEETITGLERLNTIQEESKVLENQVRVYPNPSNGRFYIEPGLNATISEAMIYDIQGKLVKQYGSFHEKMEVSGLDKGVYVIRVVSEGASFNFKLIVNP